MLPASSEIYTNTKDTWEAMLRSCEAAHTSIDIEQYIFICNEVGNRFLEVLKKKSKEGVRVRLLADTAGSYAFYQSAVPSELKAFGIEVRFFNIISPWRIHNIFSWFFRNHRKTLIVDQEVGFTGGTGIADHMESWRDTTARVTGEVVNEMSDSFLEMWELADNRDFLSKIKKWRALKKKTEFVTNAPYFKKRFLYYAILQAVKTAEREILLTTPYFIPDRKLIRALSRAARRGVEVKIILPEKIDVPIVSTASHSSFGEILKSGVRIFKYQPKVLHAKTAVVDGEWGTYGSFNLDSLSFRYNYEANIITTDVECVQVLRQQFLDDLENCKEVSLKEWRSRSLLQKFQEFLVAPIRGVL